MSTHAGIRLTYEPVAYAVTLWHRVDDPDPRAVFDLALAPLDALRDVLDPLALRLWLTARPADDPYPNRAIPVPRPMWQLALDDQPDGVRPDPPPGRPFVTATAPDLSRERLHRWYADALDQPAPAPGTVLTLQTLICEDARARLVTPSPPDTCSLVVEDGLTVTRPLHADASGAWVAFPMPELTTEPPVRVRVTNEGDALVTEIWASWTPWSTSGTPEAEAIRAGVAQLEAQEWYIDDPAQYEVH